MGKVFLSIGSRMLICYLVYNYVAASTNAASVDSSDYHSNGDLMDAPSGDDSCSYNGIQYVLTHTPKSEINQVTDELFKQCRLNFLNNNQVDPLIKRTVDKWLNLDLALATPDERWMAYQMALMLESSGDNVKKIDNVEFVTGCRNMLANYEQFRDDTSQLSEYINIESDWWQTESSEVDMSGPNPSRDLINYAQYSLFCSSMIQNNPDLDM